MELKVPRSPTAGHLAIIRTCPKVPIWEEYQNLKVDKDCPGFYIGVRKSRYLVCITNL